MSTILVTGATGQQGGTLALGLPPDRKLQSIAVENVGNFLAFVLERPEQFIGRRVNIASEKLSGKEYAAVISRTIGKRVTYFQIPLDQIRVQNEDFACMYEWFDLVGYSADIDSLYKDYPEIGWLCLEAWAKSRDWKVLDRAS